LTPLLFGVSIASLFSVKRLRAKIAVIIFPVISSVLLVYSLPQYVLWSGDAFPDRLLILFACCLIILSAVTISTLVNTSQTSWFKFSIAKQSRKIEVKKMLIFGIAILFMCSLIPSHMSYVAKFDSGYNNAQNWYGASTINWIQDNTLSGDVFLAAEPRRLAWLTDRTFVGMTTSSGNLDISSLRELISDYNITYVVVDTFLINYKTHSQFFDNLYSKIDSGEITPVTSDSATNGLIEGIVESSNLNYSKDTYGLKLIFSYAGGSQVTRIYQVEKLTMTIKTSLVDDSFVSGWVPKRGGTLKSSDYAYISLSNALAINSSQFPCLSVKVRGDTNATSKFWISAIDTNGEWHQIQADIVAPSEFKIYTYRFSNMTANIADIYLGVSGSDWPIIEYDWLAIYGWQLK
jgi:hypothetical protein